MNKRAPARVTFKASESFSGVESAWREFLPANHHLVSDDVAALEASRPPDIAFHYVNIYEDNELIGVMYLQCLLFNRDHYQEKVLDRPVLKWFKNLVLRYQTRIMICGNLFRVNFQGFYFKDKSRREMVFDYLKQYRSSLADGGSYSGILVKDCSRVFEEIQFGCHSFRSFNQDLTMELEIRDSWRSMEDYLGSLTRKYRQRANKIISSLAGIEVRSLTVAELETHKTRVGQLYRNILDSQSLALGILNADYFIRMKQSLGEKFRVYGYFKDEEMLAFSSHIYYPPNNCMEIHYIGIDYQHNNTHNLYFNILFDGIRSAIEGRYRKIEMGRTAREAKASAGAKPVENYNYIWIKPGPASLTVRFLGNWFENSVGDEWKKRDPFKPSPQKEAVPVQTQT